MAGTTVYKIVVPAEGSVLCFNELAFERNVPCNETSEVSIRRAKHLRLIIERWVMMRNWSSVDRLESDILAAY